MKKILFFLILLGISLPVVSLAVAGTYQADGHTICYEGLVPCGKTVYDGGTVSDGKCSGGAPITISCQTCHFFVMLDAVLDFILFKLVLPVGALMLAIAGLMYVGAIFEILPGGFRTLTQAKEIFSSVFIGFFVIFGAWLLLNLFFTLIGVADWTGLATGWFQIDCPIELP